MVKFTKLTNLSANNMFKKIFIFILFIPYVVFAQTLTSTTNKPKLFLYSSDLPIKLEQQSQVIRKHIIDTVLMDNRHDLMLSNIPDQIVTGKTPQFILKYKLRTDGQETYKLSFFLIDIDKHKIIRNAHYPQIKVTQLIEDLRLNLFSFLQNKLISLKERKILRQRTQKKLKTLGNLPRAIRENDKENISKITTTEENALSPPTQKPPRQKEKMSRSLQKIKKINKSLWALLKDEDVDIPWVTTKSLNSLKSTPKPKNKPSKISSPFNEGSKINFMLDDSNDLDYNRYHLSYKFAVRNLLIKDIITTDTEYQSVLGISFEWFKYSPLHISPFTFRLKTEFDTPLETQPVQLDGHFNMTGSIGYRFKNRYIFALAYDIDRMNYPNLNEENSTIVPNSFTVYWLDLELIYFHTNFNLGLTVSHLLNSKNSGEDQSAENRAESDFTGQSYNLKLRYYLQDRFFDQFQAWMGLQYRYYNINRKNSGADTKITSRNYIYHFGIYF